MELDLNRVTQITQVQETLVRDNTQRPQPKKKVKAMESIVPDKTIATSFKAQELHKSTIDIQKQLQDILHMTDTLNKRLKFTVNREIDQVVVKVIDKETDKVIKEIPPESLMRLHVRMKEAIGLLIDEQI